MEIYGPFNPEAYIRGRQQVEQSIAQQQEMIRQQRLQNGRATNNSAYEAQLNTLKLENLRLQNEALTRKNAASASQRLPYGRERVLLTLQQYARSQRITDDELRRMGEDAQRMNFSSDATTQGKRQRLMQIFRLAAEIQRR